MTIGNSASVTADGALRPAVGKARPGRASDGAARKPQLARGSGWKRRLEILAAANQLLQHAGPDAVTIRQVGADVGVASTLLYHHFPSRAALLADLCRTHLQDLLAQMSAGGQAPPHEVLRRRLAAYFEFARAKPEVYRLAFAPLVAASDDPTHDLGRIAEAESVWRLLATPAAASSSLEASAPRGGLATPFVGAAHGVALVISSATDPSRGLAGSAAELAEQLARIGAVAGWVEPLPFRQDAAQGVVAAGVRPTPPSSAAALVEASASSPGLALKETP